MIIYNSCHDIALRNVSFDDSQYCTYSAQITKKLKKKIELAMTELLDRCYMARMFAHSCREKFFFEKKLNFSKMKWNNKNRGTHTHIHTRTKYCPICVLDSTKFVNRRSVPRGFVYLGEQFLIFCYNSVGSIDMKRKVLQGCML